MGSSAEIKLPVLATEDNCIACLACENSCVKDAISHYMAEDGHVYVNVDPEKCIGCQKCQTICESSRKCFGDNNIDSSQLYAAWASDNEYRSNATSGGVFGAFAETIINRGGCVIGAELDGFDCRHTAIYRKEDIHRLQGSKYMASSMENVYRIISQELPERDVLFTGLGCQCAGVISFFSGFKTTHKLYTVDLVCGGSPSRILIDKFRDDYPEAKGIVSFRSKDKYKLIVSTEHGHKEINEKNILLHGFNCGLTNRWNCYNCQYAKAHRKTDITIGDLWDYSSFPEEHSRGISMVIVHSESGKVLLEKSGTILKTIDWEGTLKHNPRIVCGSERVFYPRKKLIDLKKTMEDEQFHKLFTMDIKPSEVSLFPFRLYRYLVQKREKKLRLKAINEIVRKSTNE